MTCNVEDNLLFVLKATSWKDKKAMKARIDEVLTSVSIPLQALKDT